MNPNFFFRIWRFCVFQSTMAFNIDPVAWKTFTSPSINSKAFGYKTIQQDLSLIVSDPLIQVDQTHRGQIYTCKVTSTCSALSIDVPPEALNMSLGLSMTKDSDSAKLLICGPTIPKKCQTITTYNGMCFESANILIGKIKPSTVPRFIRDCPDMIDIAFLLDGSGSVGSSNFITMKKFVVNIIKRFAGRDMKFAIAQYSQDCQIHYNFKNLDVTQWTWEHYVMNIVYKYGPSTFTATAIRTLVQSLFTSVEGSRPSAKKVLLVITDGQSHDYNILSAVAREADVKNIIRFAIGVGDAFNSPNAKHELYTIASDPDASHVFSVTDFNALNGIVQRLEENIIAIEGTQTSGDSSKLEFAQDGFSAAFSSYDEVLLTAVGAFQWKGGYQHYSQNREPNRVFQTGSEHDSYLGYALTTARLSYVPDTMVLAEFAVLGAPRYNHQGQVIISDIRTNVIFKEWKSPKPQIGSYFGAEVCAVDLDSDLLTDLLLVSAPTHTEASREGKVFVYFCTDSGWQPHCEFVHELEGTAGQRGRFGSSLASPADLNADGFSDVLIGAPLEDDGQGSVYVFNGRSGGIIQAYSQRITGSSVKSGLHFFGISLSQFSPDQSGDDLPDIAVGSTGQVLLLRTRPIVLLNTKVSYSPSKIQTGDSDCTKPLENTMNVCFTLNKYKHELSGLTARINYTITLDAKRLKFRAFFSPKRPLLNTQTDVSLKETCQQHKFSIEACPEDALNSLSNQLSFTFTGLPTQQNLKPVLLPEVKTTTDHNLDFEISCGDDNVCVDDLRMDFNFSGALNVEVGIMQEINVTVFVENRGENSYNTFFTVNYPFGLSFRRSNTKQGRVECLSLDGEQGFKMGETICHISKPILKGNALVLFELTYTISRESTFGPNMTFSASVQSSNDQHSSKSELSKKKSLNVKYGIYIALIRHENSTIHINFTSGKKDLEKPIKQILQVENDFRELTFTVFIKVPVKLGNIDIWTGSNMQISGCNRQKEEQPVIPAGMEIIKKQLMVNCSVAICAVFRCDVNLRKNEKVLFNVSGNISSRWIGQTGVKAAVFQLVSSASLDYDRKKFVFFSSDSQRTAPTVQITTQVEVYEEVDRTLLIVGGVFGGLIMLALVTVALYKAGFFKSQYKQMLEEAHGGGEEPQAAAAQ